jgi:hypothetical protein
LEFLHTCDGYRLSFWEYAVQTYPHV